MLSVSHMTYLSAPPEEFLLAASQAGFGGVGLRIFPPPHDPGRYPVAGDAARLRYLRSLSTDTGVAVFEAESFNVGEDFHPEACRPGLEAAEYLGAKYLVSTGADPAPARMKDNYCRFAELLGEFDLSIAIEFNPSRSIRTLEDAVSIYDSIAPLNASAGLLIDVLHLYRSGGDLASLSEIGDRKVHYLHLCDAPLRSSLGVLAESRGGRLPPGEGELPLRSFVSHFPAGTPVSLEIPSSHLERLPVAQAMKHLKTAFDQTIGMTD